MQHQRMQRMARVNGLENVVLGRNNMRPAPTHQQQHMEQQHMNHNEQLALRHQYRAQPQPFLWQLTTLGAFVIPFVVCLIKFDLNIALGVFLLTYFIISFVAFFKAAQISRRLRVPEAEFLRSLHQQLDANPQSVQDQNATLHLYLSLMDRDFGANDYELLSTLDEMNTEHKGASPEQIKSLEAEKWSTHLNISKCTICLDTFSSTAIIKSLPCSHVYHDRCIDQWLSLKPSCPICKHEVF